MGGESQTLEGSDLADMKVNATLNAELFYPQLGVTLVLEGIEEVDGADAYRLLLTNPSGTQTTTFIDVATGLKIKEINEQGTATFADYREINGVKFPFTLGQQMGPQTMDLKVLSVKVNTKLKDDLFTIE